ncbi:Putative ribonuclease H protein At1g65750 [Linum perenne]
MTNLERTRRHISHSDTCTVCGRGAESLDQLFRYCDVATAVWNACLPQVLSPTQRQWDFETWWSNNVGDHALNPTFGVVAWLLWSRRNKLIFEGITWSAEEVNCQVKFWVLLLSSSWKAGQLGREAPGIARQTQLIGWRPADEGWFTLNYDGSLYTQNNRAAAGGLIRDCRGDFVTAFTMNLGVCSVTRAELRGIIEGMRIAWNRGVRRLAIQTYSSCAVKILSNLQNLDHQHAGLARIYAEMIGRDWEVSLEHVYRESNRLADSLAVKGHASPYRVQFVEGSDPVVAPWLDYDHQRTTQPRLVMCKL